MSELIGYLSEVEQLNGELTIPKQLGGSTLGSKTITANGVYDATDDGVDGYDVVTANVPNTYTAGDEGKVVDNGALVSQTSATYTLNNTYDTTLINSVTVNVSGGSTPTLETVTKTYTPTTSQQTETITPSSGYDGIGEVDVTVNAIPSQYIIPTGTKSISSNGTGIDVKAYEYADVAVPNSYSASDEGKVVDNGALIAQTAHADVTPTTSDQTIDTTTNNSIKVKGDADLVAANIKKDVEIFGVTGSYEGGGGGDNTKYLNLIARTGTSFIDDDVDSVGNSAFRSWTTLQDLSLPNLVTVGDSAFYGCSAIKNFYFPKATTIAGANAFNGAGTANSVIVLPLLATYPNTNAINSFKGKAVDLGESISTIKSYMFQNNASMGMLVLRKQTVAGLDNINALNGTPFASGKAGGILYVPSSLISNYQGASNWSTILGYATNQIKSIESTHTDPTAPIDLTLYYADGTLIPT